MDDGIYGRRSDRRSSIYVSLPSIQKCGVQNVQPNGTRNVNA